MIFSFLKMRAVEVRQTLRTVPCGAGMNLQQRIRCSANGVLGVLRARENPGSIALRRGTRFRALGAEEL